ncbi:MAG: hypothetical protein ACOX7K_06225 [Oscillospiraceae bacterium]|jgi:cell division protein FtsL
MTTTSYPTRRTRQRGISLFGMVGSVLAIVLVLLTFRERVALTALSDQVSIARTTLAELEAEQRTLLIERETAVSLDELEDYAMNTLGLVRPDARNLRWIEK